MPEDPLTGAFGSRLSAAMAAMDADVLAALVDLGLADYRPKFSVVIRVIDADGPSTISEIAGRIHVTHSAASQTVTEMTRRGLVELAPGPSDARQRVVRLTAQARALLPAINAEWTSTARAIDTLGKEMSASLEQITRELTAALQRRSFRERIADAAAELPRTKHRTALIGRRRG